MALLLAGCGGGSGASSRPSAAASSAPSVAASVAATTAPTVAATTAVSAAPSTAATVCSSLPAGSEGDLLAQICQRGKLLVSTDPNYAPQSFLRPDGTFEGFDIDTANEIGKRLGVTVQFETPSFDAVVAGGWNGRWDISVGSVTITEERQGILDFTQPYYYTPAQMAATTASGITDLAGLAGKKICVGSSTTYQFWLEGTLKLVGSPPPATPPDGATPFPLETDQDCAQSVSSGRSDFEGWLSSSTTVDSAIKAGTGVVKVGDPVFYEALAVATDKNGADHDALSAALDKIIGDMHADGTLTASSMHWFDGLDLTVVQ
jgi:polar amino acid transport system substrate-binding protein